MNKILNGIRWQEQGADSEGLIARLEEAAVTQMKGGLEAEVHRITLPDTKLVLKIWNRESRPDISIQYQVLEQLFRQGCAVSRPYAWGLDAEGHQVLLTSFDGMPVKKVNADSLTAIAANLLDVHKLEIDSSSSLKVPAYDFADYFFPSWAEQPEIRSLAQELAERGKLTAHQLIHGDYHLGNVLESSGKFTIIDWTNVQHGDPRYDIAWSILLFRVYLAERNASVYRSAFAAKCNYSPAELELFEALAALRWLQLHRTTGVPVQRNTLKVMRTLIRENRYLPDSLSESL
ncbi:aminoglycoside phosphotransferase family protein [Paenibacillus sp. FSL P4-0338]|uniref:aminoglycoside phosphotransferase family protein n=1 Tax=unclassified Paenibacillus TaxID=185978 RepID=UPI0003E1D772|nr:aminoglycoside phosphotransferase family protein [Paenibacillus sp. FSL R7-269]ETT33966.1 aminoglycoside phosphotransferase [Paenibacillus sp. FSL R7-269]